MTQEQAHRHRSCVFSVNFEHMSLFVLMLLLISAIKNPTTLVCSLTRLKKHASELKFFVLIFRKLEKINM